jgi:hypothetical protein
MPRGSFIEGSNTGDVAFTSVIPSLALYDSDTRSVATAFLRFTVHGPGSEHLPESTFCGSTSEF